MHLLTAERIRALNEFREMLLLVNLDRATKTPTPYSSSKHSAKRSWVLCLQSFLPLHSAMSHSRIRSPLMS